MGNRAQLGCQVTFQIHIFKKRIDNPDYVSAFVIEDTQVESG